MSEFVNSTALLLVLLNPFLVIVYLVDVIAKLNRAQFARVLFRAGLISGAVFCAFAILGDAIFGLMQADFASFQIFGGVVFLLIGLQFVFKGPDSIQLLRGDSEHIAGAIAMPVLIGPGTISASVLIGQRHDTIPACSAVLAAVFLCLITMVLLKALHDWVIPRKEGLVQRYIEVAGRITALFVGTWSVQMIMQGLSIWIAKFQAG